MKILIIVSRQTMMGSYHLPLGIGYVSASLKRAGHDVTMLNPNHSMKELGVLVEECITRIVPDIVATGGMSFHLNEVISVTTLARRLLPSARIIIGGPLVTSQPEIAMQAIPEADFGVIGEGEYTTAELIEKIKNEANPADVTGIIYRLPEDRSAIKQTERRPIGKNLDAYPQCDHEGLGLEIYAGIHRPGECAPALIKDYSTRVMPILTSRGCPYTCTFCCHEVAGQRYRQRSLDSVFAEIHYAIENFNINALFILDDLFCLKRERLEEFCHRVSSLNLRWECSMTAGQINPEVLALMKDSGCCCISVGVESMSQKVLTSMQKRATKEQIEKALPMIYEHRIAVWSNLIFFDPVETLETVMESLEWSSNHPQYNFRFARIGYHPGSIIYDHAIELGLINDPINYLKANKCEINATAMSDDAYQTASILINQTLLSFGHAGKLLEITNNRSGTLVARCVCPYCGEEGYCNRLDKIHNLIAKINCPVCNRAYRVPVFVRYKTPESALELVESTRNLEVNGATVEKLNAASMRIISLDPCNCYGWDLLVNCADKSGDPIKAVQLMERLICIDPYNPALFESMADRLNKIGSLVFREKYVLKAAHLRQIGVTHTAIIEVVMSPEELKTTIESQFVLMNINLRQLK